MFQKPDGNQRNFLEIIYVPDSIVWVKVPTSEDIQTPISTGLEILGRFDERKASKAALDTQIGSMIRRDSDPAWPAQVSKDLYKVPGRRIAALCKWFKPSLDFDPIQAFKFHETSASTIAEPYMVLREKGSGWSIIVRKRSKEQI